MYRFNNNEQCCVVVERNRRKRQKSKVKSTCVVVAGCVRVNCVRKKNSHALLQCTHTTICSTTDIIMKYSIYFVFFPPTKYRYEPVGVKDTLNFQYLDCELCARKLLWMTDRSVNSPLLTTRWRSKISADGHLNSTFTRYIISWSDLSCNFPVVQRQRRVFLRSTATYNILIIGRVQPNIILLTTGRTVIIH